MKPPVTVTFQAAQGYLVQPDEPAYLAALAVIRSASSPEKLVNYALSRQGFCDSDGFFGVTYPEDLDEYDKMVVGTNIPEGFVEVIAWFGEHHGPSYLLEESTYREILRQYLVLAGKADLARELIQLTVKPILHLPGPMT